MHRGYDHRGHSYTFTHKTLGNLGRLVLIGTENGQTLLQPELYVGQQELGNLEIEKRKEIFEKVISIIRKNFYSSPIWS